MIPSESFAKNYLEMFNIVYRNNLHYSSYLFLKKSLENNFKIEDNKIHTLLDVIHPSVYIHDNDLDGIISKKTELDFAVGLRRFFMNDFEVAKKKLRSVSSKNPMFIESNYLLGLIYLTENKTKHANAYFKKCVRFSAKKKRSEFKSDQYVETFRNRCVQQVARLAFAEKSYQSNIKILDYVEKNDYLWPRFLIDKAWSYFHLGEYERALGTVVTYKAPLLKRFMIPEASYLRALIYYKLCLYDKSEKVYNEFNSTTWRYRKVAKTVSRNKLLSLIESKNEPKRKSDVFLYYYLKGYKKDIRYYTYKKSITQLEDEIKKLTKIRNLKQANIFLNSLYFYKNAIQEDFKDFLKNVSDDYYLQISQMRSSFVKLNLMISLNKRKQITSNNKDTNDKEYEAVSLDKISATDDKFIWDFQGGFWADELGDYAVALKSRCK